MKIGVKVKLRQITTRKWRREKRQSGAGDGSERTKNERHTTKMNVDDVK